MNIHDIHTYIQTYVPITSINTKQDDPYRVQDLGYHNTKMK